MFGSNPVQSTWGSNQQQQNQPQQGTGAFGQPSTFGSTNTFGTTGAFGQPQQQPQQQQPSANPMFGGLGSGTTSGTTGFGAFGSNQPNAFGAKPNTGFGAFGGGGTSTFGSNTFGSTNNATTTPATTSSLFGQPSTSTTGAFGSTTFSAPKPAAFGSTPSQGGDNTGPVTTGSLNPPYSVFSEKDAQNANLVIQYQAITCMPAYRGTSFEELRIQDYAQGRKTSTSTTGGAFGQTSSTFGSTTNNAFGQPAQPAANPFGSTSATNTTTPAQPGGFGAFGQQQTQPATTSGFGAFGQTQQPQQQQQQQQQQPQTTGFGAFGQQNTQPSTGGSLFGGFGQPNKPAFSTFGTTSSTGTNTFGNTGTSTFGTGTSAFGTTQQQQQQQQQPQGAFGQTTQPTNTGFGAFGNNTNNANKPLFGQPAQPAQPATTGFGTFGQPAQNQGTTQPTTFGTGLFGNNNNTGGLFGQNNQQQQQQPLNQPTAGFGTINTTGTTGFGSNLFANTNQQPQQQQQPTAGFGAFGKPAAPAGQTNLFGGLGQTNTTQNTAPTSGMFGNTQPAAQPTGGFGSIFGGAKPAPAAGTTPSTGLGSVFGGNNTQNLTSANTFGTNGTQGTLTASINQPIGSNLPIFAMLPPGPRAITLDQSQSKKKAGFFVDVPTRSPVPRVQLGGFTPATSKLRGFGSSTSTSVSPGISFSSGKPNALSLSKQPDSLTPDALLGGRASPSLGSGERRSVKKLILDKKVEATDLFSRSGSTSPGLRAKVTFSPALSIAAREKDATTTFSPSPTVESPSPASRTQRTTNRFTGVTDGEGAADGKTLKEGDYWSKPDLQALMNLGHAELRSCKDLIVGRVGYGEVHFLEPVDLTGLSKLSQLYGDVIRFDDKECSVYPDVDDSEKPPVGTHLNVRARITLIRCWVNDKATREPIKTENHPLMIKHLKKLKNMRDTKFESFEVEEGRWVFTVEHF